MYAILISAFNYILGWLLKEVTLKAVIFGVMAFLISELMGVMKTLLPQSTNLAELFDMLPESAWYFINLAELPFGLSLVMSAMATRFIIGMIPFIGR